MSDGWYYLLVFLSPLLQNMVLAWAFTAITNGDSSAFWMAFFVLLAIRLFFYVVDAVFTALSYTLYRKKFVVRKIVEDFRRLGFPQRENLNEDWMMYLQRLEGSETVPFAIRRAAVFMQGQFDFASKSGFLLGRHSESAMEVAVDAWSTTPQVAIQDQRKADEREYWEYSKANHAIRKKYDPRGEWDEATQLPQEFLREIHALNLAHQAMLRRRNGWTDVDFHAP